MRYKDLEKIIDEEMKTNNACDVYKLTTEHLKFSGRESRLVILNLINERRILFTNIPPKYLVLILALNRQ